MVFKAKLAVCALFMGLGMHMLPLVAAEAPLPAAPAPREKSEKDEKEIDAKQRAEEQEIAVFIRDIPDQIPFDMSEGYQIKDKEGKPVKESLSSADDEALLLVPFKDIIAEALKNRKQPVIARVVTQMPDGSLAVHYFDVEELRKSMSGPLGHRNPLTKQPIKQLCYCVYIPEFKHCIVVCSEKDLRQLLPISEIQEWAMKGVVERLDLGSKKSKNLWTYLSKQAKNDNVRCIACLNVGISLCEGLWGSQDITQSRALLKPLVKIYKDNPTLLTFVQAYLAIGYYKEESGKYDKKALSYALQAINNETDLSKDPNAQAQLYCIVGILLKIFKNHEQADNALSFLVHGIHLAEQIALPPVFIARAHAHLALCYYNEPKFGAVKYEEGEGRYTKAWYHTTQALKYYEQIKDIPDFFEMLVEMSYFALGNEGDVKKALAYIDEYKKQHSSEAVPEKLRHIICHRNYYHVRAKDPVKKKEALQELQELIIDREEEGTIDDPVYYTQYALLGEMYVHESRYAREQAELHIKTDPHYARDCDLKASDFDIKAMELFQFIINVGKKSKEFNASYAWVLTHYVLGCRELWRPVKNYEQARRSFQHSYFKNKEFPLLASSAGAALSELVIKKKTEDEYGEDLADSILAKDPRYYECVFKNAMHDFNDSLFEDDKQVCSILERLQLVAEKAPKGSVLKMQAGHAFKIVQKYRSPLDELYKAKYKRDKIAVYDHLITLTKSPDKTIQKKAYYWLEKNHFDSLFKDEHFASMSLDAALDGQKPAAGGSLAMPEDAVGVDMDERGDNPRGKKRKAEESLADPHARGSESNGSGSGQVAQQEQ